MYLFMKLQLSGSLLPEQEHKMFIFLWISIFLYYSTYSMNPFGWSPCGWQYPPFGQAVWVHDLVLWSRIMDRQRDICCWWGFRGALASVRKKTTGLEASWGNMAMTHPPCCHFNTPSSGAAEPSQQPSHYHPVGWFIGD